MVGYAVLFSWPLVMIVLFKKLPAAEALVWSILGAYLFLPSKIAIDLPLLPTIDKGFIPSIMSILLLAGLIRQNGQQAVGRDGRQKTSGLNMAHVLPGWLPKSWVIKGLLALFFIGIFMTVLTNGDRQVFPFRVLRPMQIYDGFSNAMNGMVALLPLLLARKFLGHPDTHVALLRVACIAGLIYTLPALLEIRISPRLNLMIYGFQTQHWLQGARGGGWRPTVFLSHGLVLALFFAMSIIATAACVRVNDKKRRLFYLCALGWLVMTLMLSNSLGALLIVLILLPAVFLLTARVQMIMAACVAATVLTYPLLRSADLMPVDKIVEMASRVDPARAGSLAYRIDNEDILLAKANERPAFGWGGWGRSRVYNEQGHDVSDTDGIWVIYLGVGGWANYLMRFGVLTIPIIFLALRRRGDPVRTVTALMTLVLAANLIDMIPNSANTPLAALIAGALIGRLEYERVEQAAAVSEHSAPNLQAPTKGRNPEADSPRPQLGYARRGPMSKISNLPRS